MKIIVSLLVCGFASVAFAEQKKENAILSPKPIHPPVDWTRVDALLKESRTLRKRVRDKQAGWDETERATKQLTKEVDESLRRGRESLAESYRISDRFDLLQEHRSQLQSEKSGKMRKLAPVYTPPIIIFVNPRPNAPERAPQTKESFTIGDDPRIPPPLFVENKTYAFALSNAYSDSYAEDVFQLLERQSGVRFFVADDAKRIKLRLVDAANLSLDDAVALICRLANLRSGKMGGDTYLILRARDADLLR